MVKIRLFINIIIWEIKNSESLEQIWKRWGPDNDEDPFQQILEILDMGPIPVSARKHEMEMWYQNEETKKPSNRTNKKPRHQETKKPRNQETNYEAKQLRN